MGKGKSCKLKCLQETGKKYKKAKPPRGKRGVDSESSEGQLLFSSSHWGIRIARLPDLPKKQKQKMCLCFKYW